MSHVSWAAMYCVVAHIWIGQFSKVVDTVDLDYKPNQKEELSLLTQLFNSLPVSM